MMEVRVKGDSATIEGYVNVVERDSDILTDKGVPFIERIKQGAFKKSLRRSHDVKVLLNHDITHEVASRSAKTAELREDAVGLWCRATVTDATLIEKAKRGLLSGWSFGFIPLLDTRSKSGNVEHREITDLDLKEVSILDDTKTPAYPATFIMTRDTEEGEVVEIRVHEDEISVKEDELETREEENANPGGDADKSAEEGEGAGTPADVNYHYHNRLKMAGIRK